MMQHQHNLRKDPWYRKCMPRSYIAPHWLASFGCSKCLIFFGMFFLLFGAVIMISMVYADNAVRQHYNYRTFNYNETSREQRKSILDFSRFTSKVFEIALIVTCLGVLFIIFAVGTCLFVKYCTNKQNLVAAPSNQLGNTCILLPQPLLPAESHLQQLPLLDGFYPQQLSFLAGSSSQQPPLSAGSQHPPQSAEFHQQQPPPPSYGYPEQYALIPGSYLQQLLTTLHSPYPPPTQSPTSELYVKVKNDPYLESRGTATANTPPINLNK